MGLTLAQKLKSLVLVTVSGGSIFTGTCYIKGNEQFYSNVLMPTMHILNPELTHNLGVFACKYNLFPKSQYADPKCLKVNLFGKQFSNPIGMPAGFDKNAEAVTGLQKIGFGFVEIGSVLPEPQPGNPRPRVFRLPEDLAVINRYGFNSDGHAKVYERLETLRNLNYNGIIGVNLGKNTASPSALEDYTKGIKKFGDVADYFVINISCPNTPRVLSMQNNEKLRELLSSVINTRNELPEKNRPPILIKLSPDLTSEDRFALAKVLKLKECRVDGLIISNTTVDRTGLQNVENSIEIGGLSGKPLKEESTKMISEMYKLTDGMTIIGVGGIFSGKDAYEKIKAGASLVQFYTAFIYHGPPSTTRIKKELVELLEADGYKCISDAVGKDAK